MVLNEFDKSTFFFILADVLSLCFKTVVGNLYKYKTRFWTSVSDTALHLHLHHTCRQNIIFNPQTSLVMSETVSGAGCPFVLSGCLVFFLPAVLRSSLVKQILIWMLVEA